MNREIRELNVDELDQIAGGDFTKNVGNVVSHSKAEPSKETGWGMIVIVLLSIL